MKRIDDWTRAAGSGRLLALLLGLGLSTACWLDDEGLTGPGSVEEAEPEAPGAPLLQIAELVCRVDLTADSVDCGAPNPQLPDEVSGLIIGGQGEFIELQSENVQYDGAKQIFQADVTVRNLLHQAIGTRNWETVAPEGVRVVYQREPFVTEGEGEIELLEIDGHELFVASEQPYYQYDEMLEPKETSAPRTWKWRVPGTVTAFEFSVFVSAPVPFPNGWIVPEEDWTIVSIDEGGYQFNVKAVDAFGRELDFEEFEWETWDPDVVEVSQTGYVTFLRDGSAQIEVRVPEREGVPELEWALIGIGIVPTELEGPVPHLDGSSNYVTSFRHPQLTDPSKVSFEFWFEAALAGDGEAEGESGWSMPLFAWLELTETGPKTTSGVTIEVEDGYLVASVMTGTDTPVRIEATGGPVERGRWHHVALIFDAGQVRLYQDGALVASGAAALIFPPGDVDYQNVPYMGCGDPNFSACGRYFRGAFDDVRFWATALDASVIEAWRKRPVTREHPEYPSLRGYWLGTSNALAQPTASFTERTRWRLHSRIPGWQPIRWTARTGRIVSLEPRSHRFTFAGQTVQLHAEAIDRFGEPVEVTWSTTDPEVATVDENGLVTSGTTLGTAGIVASTPDGAADTAWVEWDRIIFVNAAATGQSNGRSWADAYTDLQDALADARAGDEIWVASGTYTPSRTGDRSALFVIPGDVAVYGGFLGHEREREARRWWEYETILSGDLNGDDGPGFTNRGDNSERIVDISPVYPAAGAILDGFIITGANGLSRSQGGAVYVAAGEPTLRNLTIRGNQARSGAAIYIQGGRPKIINSVLVDNVAELDGGVLASINPAATATFINTTIVGSQAPKGAVFSAYNPTIVVENSIIWENGVADKIFDLGQGSLTLRNAIVQGGCPAAASCTAVSAQDPLFWNLAARDLRLQPGSPAIDAGDGSAYPEDASPIDIGGEQRVHGVAIDIGAHEFHGAPVVAPRIDVDRTLFDFGPVPARDTVEARGVMVTNAGTAPLIIGTVRVEGLDRSVFEVAKDACTGIALAPGTSCDVHVRFMPDTVQGYTATLRIEHNSQEGVSDVELKGTGTGRTIFVNTTATGAATGRSWADALTDLQQALAQARSGDEIWVAAGTYTPSATGDRNASFMMKKGVQILGGFAGHEATRDQRRWWENETILSGDLGGNDRPDGAGREENSHRIVQALSVDSTAVLDGFTLTGASGGHEGGAIYAHSHSPTTDGATFRNLVIRDNEADSGAGIYVSRNAPTVVNTIFIGNRARLAGGAAELNDADGAWFANVTIHGNSAGNSAGGISIVAAAGQVRVQNAIIWGNTALTSPQIVSSLNRIDLRAIIVEGGCTHGQWVEYCGPDIRGVDPMFVDPAAGNLTLQAGSPAINAGVHGTLYPGAVPALDLAGNRRIVGGKIDLGVYEWQ